jgi:hypothetical protein
MGLMDRMKAAQQQASEAMSNAGGMKGMMGSMAPGNMAEQMAYRDLAQKLKASGVEAPAKITAIRDTGERDMGGGQKTQVDVTIAPSDGAPYETTITQSFIASQLAGLAVGGAATVKYDPDDRQKALLYGW